ncbi:hypothetical protein LRS56_08500 [Pseudomonas poae]|nr:hypothetical protein LRS56_08500 [Pseudomonas poae]
MPCGNPITERQWHAHRRGCGEPYLAVSLPLEPTALATLLNDLPAPTGSLM